MVIRRMFSLVLSHLSRFIPSVLIARASESPAHNFLVSFIHMQTRIHRSGVNNLLLRSNALVLPMNTSSRHVNRVHDPRGLLITSRELYLHVVSW